MAPERCGGWPCRTTRNPISRCRHHFRPAPGRTATLAPGPIEAWRKKGGWGQIAHPAGYAPLHRVAGRAWRRAAERGQGGENRGGLRPRWQTTPTASLGWPVCHSSPGLNGASGRNLTLGTRSGIRFRWLADLWLFVTPTRRRAVCAPTSLLQNGDLSYSEDP